MPNQKAQKPKSGSRNRIARDNQLLPSEWRQLQQSDLQRIHRTQRTQLEKSPSLDQLEACLMLRAMITTARPLKTLLPLRIQFVAQNPDPKSLASGLINHDGNWSWWLPAGRPDLKDHPKGKWSKSTPGMIQTSPNVWIPSSVEVSKLVQRCLSARGRKSEEASLPLFTSEKSKIKELILEILHLTENQNSGIRRSAKTIESTQRWLPRKITQVASGDPAAASIITERHSSLAKPMTHYGALSIPRAIEIHSNATMDVDRHHHQDCPDNIATLSVGDPNTPTDEAVSRLAAKLAADLNNAKGMVTCHRAMVRQTCALLAFALGLRGIRRVPTFGAIDERTGFCLIADKDVSNPHAKRLVWVPPLARDQLRYYEEHLKRLKLWLGNDKTRKLLSDAPSHRVTLFSVHRPKRIERIKPSLVLAELQKIGWMGEENAGRHWLRSKLSGLCSGETLAAFFGHSQLGSEAWRSSSALDPLMYRADLERCLGSTLSSAGWRALSSPQQTL
ncbi:hypothetical protein GRI69_04460 [Erythrobacter vulgaris]|uniref:Uncharacterized protein n=1 Tax=Qipengyuania vulgaris TaxID=291985 RepID=A0A844XR73_9SPHN|nr:hypothetical protein [Qipengyuania vulgaris]MXO47508.1 hypothetical protein [Qipengyuania vulgaris]